MERFEEVCHVCGKIKPDCIDDMNTSLCDPGFICRACELNGLIDRLKNDIANVKRSSWLKKACDEQISELQRQINMHSYELEVME